MQKNILLLLMMLLFMGCETGTRYDKNATTQKVPKKEVPSRVIAPINFEDLLDDSEPREEPSEFDEMVPRIKNFTGGVVSDGLEISAIRQGKHNEYLRLVFDVYSEIAPAEKVGLYKAIYNNERRDITVVLTGYRDFSATIPSFSASSIVKKIYFDKYLDESGFKFHIQLRQNAEVKIFNLENPARLVFDIKAI